MPTQLISYLQDTGFGLYSMREWLSGGAPPCQGGGRGFDPRLALGKRTIPNRYRSFFRAQSWARKFDVYAPLRSAQAEVPRTSCAVSRFFHAVAGLHPPAPSRFITNKVKKGAYVPLVYAPERLRLSAQWAAYGIILFYSHL